jgi:hypothetical protein
MTHNDPYIPTLDIEHTPGRVPPFILTKKLTRFPFLKSKVKGLQIVADQDQFVTDLGIDEVIQFVKDNHDLSLTEIVVIVMNELESYYLKPGMGEVKKQMAVQLLLPLFDGNVKITEEFVEHCMTHISQIRYLKRVAIRVYRRLFKKRSIT